MKRGTRKTIPISGRKGEKKACEAKRGEITRSDLLI